MKNEATANSFKAKMLFKGRKILISLKRNYYIIPLIFTLICAAYFLCTLYILSPVFFRIQSATSYSEFNSLFIFLVSLAVILYSIAYLNYAIKKYGKIKDTSKYNKLLDKHINNMMQKEYFRAVEEFANNNKYYKQAQDLSNKYKMYEWDKLARTNKTDYESLNKKFK